MLKFILLLGLFAPSELPQVTLTELPQSTVRVIPRYVVKVVPRPVGYHEHQCLHCGMRWGHGESSFGNRAAHTCPNCGYVQWEKAFGIQLPQKTIRVPVE